MHICPIRRVSVAVAFLAALGAGAAADSARAADSAGNTIELAKPAGTVLVISRGAGESLAAMRSPARLLGADTPERADLVICDPGRTGSIPAWQKTAPVFMYDPRDFTGLAGAIMALGELTGNPSGGIQAAARLTRSVKSVRGMLSGVKMRDYPAVFVAIGSNPLETCGKDSFLHALVREAGGKNVYSDRAGTIIAVSPDDARRRNPAYVVEGETFAAFDHSGAKNIVIDIGAAMSPGPGVTAILVKLAKSFHPDIIP